MLRGSPSAVAASRSAAKGPSEVKIENTGRHFQLTSTNKTLGEIPKGAGGESRSSQATASATKPDPQPAALIHRPEEGKTSKKTTRRKKKKMTVKDDDGGGGGGGVETPDATTKGTEDSSSSAATSKSASASDTSVPQPTQIRSFVADHARIAAGKARHKVDIDNATMPLGAVLHILRERRKDQLYLNCLWYFVFILLYTVVVNMHHHIFTSFSQNYGIRDVLLNEPFHEPDDLRTYHDVGEIDEWWLWFEGPFAQKIWSTEWYSGDSRDSETEMGVLLQECYVIGAVRLRQVRTVMEMKTAGKRTFKSWPPYRTLNAPLLGQKAVSTATNMSTLTTCGLSSSAENPLFTGGGKDGDPARGAETRVGLRTQDGTASFGDYCTGLGALDGMSYDPLQTEHYGGAGYVIDFPRTNSTHAISTIAKLKAARWIDQGTRAVAVDLNVYNPSTDTVTALRVR